MNVSQSRYHSTGWRGPPEDEPEPIPFAPVELTDAAYALPGELSDPHDALLEGMDRACDHRRNLDDDRQRPSVGAAT